MSERKDIVKKENANIERTSELPTAVPAVDIYENDEEILLYADMPGVIKEDISVNIDNGTLSLTGIRKTNLQGDEKLEEFSDVEYIRNFSVPQTIETNKVKAELKNGILRLHLPKSEAAKPKHIKIQAG